MIIFDKTLSVKLRIGFTCHLGSVECCSVSRTLFQDALQPALLPVESLLRVSGKLIKRWDFDPRFRWYPRTRLGGIRKSKKKLGQPASGSRFENKDAKFEKALTVNATLTANERMMRFRACFRWQS
jgi:hypothetical protein